MLEDGTDSMVTQNMNDYVCVRLEANFKKSSGAVDLKIMHSMAVEKFPDISMTYLSRLVGKVFPNSSRKRHGKCRTTCVVGVQLKSTATSTTTMSPSKSAKTTPTSSQCSTSSMLLEKESDNTSAPEMFSELQHEREKRRALEHENIVLRQKLEQQQSLSSEAAAEFQHEREKREALECEVSALKQRLEQQPRSQDEYKQMLVSEIDRVLWSKQSLVHGPDTVTHFDEFSMVSIVSELKAVCPEVYHLIQELGNTQRHAIEGDIPTEELKGVMAVCTLLNARSARVKGLQLMISLMLIARGAGRQVNMHRVVKCILHK